MGSGGSPERARAHAAIGAETEPDRAWPLLVERGLISAADADRPERRFVLLDCAFSHPLTVEECLLFAANFGAVTQAESLSRQLVEALQPWGAAPPPPHVRWITDRMFGPRRPGLGA